MNINMSTPHHRGGVSKRSNESARLVMTTILGIVFGFFVGLSFPSISDKIISSSKLISSFDGSFADNKSSRKSLEDVGSITIPKMSNMGNGNSGKRKRDLEKEEKEISYELVEKLRKEIKESPILNEGPDENPFIHKLKLQLVIAKAQETLDIVSELCEGIVATREDYREKLRKGEANFDPRYHIGSFHLQTPDKRERGQPSRIQRDDEAESRAPVRETRNEIEEEEEPEEEPEEEEEEERVVEQEEDIFDGVMNEIREGVEIDHLVNDGDHILVWEVPPATPEIVNLESDEEMASDAESSSGPNDSSDSDYEPGR